MPRARLVLSLLLLTAATLTVADTADGNGFQVVRRGADQVLGPAQRAVSAAVDAVQSAAAGAAGGADSAEQARLQAEVSRLTAQLRRSEGLQRRVDELDRLLALKDAGTYVLVPARVLSAGSAFGFGVTLTLDAGSRDGIKAGQTVVGPDGLVGRTVRVGPVTCTVLVLTDRGFTVGSRLARAGTVGFATGDGLGGLVYELVEGGRMQPGDVLLTTGSGTFVPGVPVGRIRTVKSDSGSLVSSAQVQPFVDVASLDLVGIVTEPARGTPRVPIEPR